MSSIAAIAAMGCSKEGSPPLDEDEEEEDCPDGTYAYMDYCLGPGLPPEDQGPITRTCATDDECMADETCGTDLECVQLDVIDDCEPYELQPIAMPMESEVISLTFVDADGDAGGDLAVGLQSGVALVLGADPTQVTTVLSTTNGGVFDLAAGDFTGDGFDDLVVRDDALSLLAGDGAGGFAAPVPLFGSPSEMEPLDWDGDDAFDLAVMEGNAARVLVDGLAASVDLDVAEMWSIAVIDIDTDGLDDVAFNVFGAPTTTVAFLGNADSDGGNQLELHSGGASNESLSAGNFTGNPSIALHRDAREGHRRVEGVNVAATFGPQLVASYAQLDAVGDVDGDGLDDLVLFDDENIVVLHGNAQGAVLFRCAATHPMSTQFVGHAVGDMDGDGRAEIVFGFQELTILRSS